MCKKRFRYESIQNAPDFPFCSERCKLIDLGHWFAGAYTVPGADEEDKSDEETNLEEEE